MILQEFDGGLIVIRQPDHGLQAAAFAARWGNDQVPPFDRRDAVIQATARHDNGWAQWEAAPSIDEATGRPHQFYTLRPHQHVPLYRRGITDAAEYDPYVGLLVSMHGAGLYNGRYGTWEAIAAANYAADEASLVAEFLEEQARFQLGLADGARTGLSIITDDPEIWYHYLLMQVWDLLSIQYAFRLASDGALTAVPRPDGDRYTIECRNVGRFSLALDPYPFDASPLHFPVELRRMEAGPYATTEGFIEALLRAPIDILDCIATRP